MADKEVDIPTKSKSLRARSIQKRLETERNKGVTKSSGYRSKNGRENGYTMSKYRRKAANAKERDRMKLVNEAFERLRDVVPETPEPQTVTEPPPISKRDLLAGSKTTKVTTLRTAISYIKSLQQLIEDINNGSINPDLYRVFHASQESDAKTSKSGKSDSNARGKNKNGKGKSSQNSRKRMINNSSSKKVRKVDNNNDNSTKDKSVFSSLDNMQQFKSKKPTDELAKFKQIYNSITLDLQQVKKKATAVTPPTPYIVVMNGNAGTVYQPVASATLPFQNFVTIQQPSKPITLSGTNVPVPLQPIGQFQPPCPPPPPLADLSSAQMLPTLELMCPTIDDSDSTLDDIEQVLKDAENFDILEPTNL